MAFRRSPVRSRSGPPVERRAVGRHPDRPSCFRGDSGGTRPGAGASPGTARAARSGEPARRRSGALNAVMIAAGVRAGDPVAASGRLADLWEERADVCHVFERDLASGCTGAARPGPGASSISCGGSARSRRRRLRSTSRCGSLSPRLPASARSGRRSSTWSASRGPTSITPSSASASSRRRRRPRRSRSPSVPSHSPTSGRAWTAES